MITISSKNLLNVSDFGLLTISNDETRYSFETVILAQTLLENKFGSSNLFWNGKEVVVADSSFNCPEGLSF